MATVLKHRCPTCGKTFPTRDPRIKHCSPTCRRSAIADQVKADDLARLARANKRKATTKTPKKPAGKPSK